MLANKLSCPICKDDLEYLPDVIKSTIAENHKKYLVEEEERERQELIEMEEMEEYDPRIEILTAIHYLTIMKIPFENMTGLEINFAHSTPLPRGGLYTLIIKNCIERLQDMVDNQPSEDDEDDDSSFELDTIMY
jgi:hypothetical protein